MTAGVRLTGAIAGPYEGELLAQFGAEQLSACSYTFEVQGGCAGATIGIQLGLMRARDFPWFAHVEINDGGGVVWDGVLETPDVDSGWITALPASGYFSSRLDDETYLSASAGPVTSSVLAASVVAGCAPALSIGDAEHWVDSQGSYAPSDYNGRQPSAIIKQLAEAVHPAGYPMAYQVWPGRQLWAVALIPPDVPDFYIGRFEQYRRKPSVAGSYGTVAVSGTTAGVATTTATATNTTFVDRLHINRMLTIPGAGEMTTSEMLTYRDAQLAQRAYPAWGATVTRTRGEGLRGPAGESYAQHLIRGGWLGVEGDLDEFGEQLLLPVVRVQRDALARSITVEAGAPLPNLGESFRRLRVDRDAMRAGSSPLSGARRGA